MKTHRMKLNICKKLLNISFTLFFVIAILATSFANVDMMPVYYPTPLDEFISIDGVGPTRNSVSSDPNTFGVPVSTPLDSVNNQSFNNNYYNNNNNTNWQAQGKTPADFIDADANAREYQNMNPTQIGINTYGSIAEPLRQYLAEQISIFGYANGYYEDNYIYSNGQHAVSTYNGILAASIQDFDGDTVPEMALFRIATEGIDEYSNKYIFMDMVRLFNGVPVVADTAVILAEQFYGESFECNVSLKLFEDRIRIYLNYVENRVRDGLYESKFKCYEFPNNLNLVCDVNLSAYEDEPIDVFMLMDQILDSGCNIRDEADICRRSFLNDDPQMVPVFTIKRVNEKMRNGYAEDYFEQVGFNYNLEEFTRLRYGYTTFIDRTK